MPVKLLYIDLFCGAGGTSTGVNASRLDGEPCAEVIACVNHDANAIASHAANHPSALHFTEDIRTLALSPLVEHVLRKRAENPEALVVLWASLECTNFSRAKGGKPRDPDSRTLADHLFRYIEALDPDYIDIENVEEFMGWGDVDTEGKPLSSDRGRRYLQWVDTVKAFGYAFEHRILNAADYGAYTSRRRFFGTFARTGLPIAWPQPTHNKKGEGAPLWRAVGDVLDLEDKGRSIFDRPRPLVDATLDRIYAGLVKFVPGGAPRFIVPTEDGGLRYEGYSSDSPALIRIKRFMCDHRLLDVKLRMFRLSELIRITGFPEDYVLKGTKEEQRKFVGNAVVVQQAQALCEARSRRLRDLNNKATTSHA